LGDPARNCVEAAGRLSKSEDVNVLRRSSLYKTEPVGLEDQPWFVNCAVEIRTSLRPRPLLEILKKIESYMGRTGTIKWGPRIIDLDILLYGQEIISEEGLTIPHPEMHKRRFVLQPLFEIAPYEIHPVYGISIKGLLDRLEDHKDVVKLDP
jgi:2-amino-4-hydroxy-6-hydroxymethyldihydropteridine diphosphokinase